MDSHPHLNAPSEGYVFVVTYGRSGSTLLQMLLNALPGYCIRGENGNTLYHLFRAWHVLQTTEAIARLRRNGKRTDSHQPWYGIEGAQTGEYARDLADAFVRDVLRLPRGTRVGGFKEIRFHQAAPHLGAYLDFMAETFPRARFVINTRDLAAVARSSWWARQPPGKVAEMLRPAEQAFAAFAERHPARTIQLRYEEYAAAPEALAPLYAFLGERFDGGAVARLMERRLDHSTG